MQQNSLKTKIHNIIFEADTPEGKIFDLALIAIICLSIVVVILESIPYFQQHAKGVFLVIEWSLTALFLIEYLLRIYCVQKPLKYIFSFFGIIDLIACLPTLLSFLIPGAQSLLVIRALRLLRIFRILKLGTYFSEGMILADALRASKAKITVFIFSIVIVVIIAGATMHLIEGHEYGFTSIPISMYWAVVTLTTVGYGDLAPQTDLGRFVASMLMILGYAIIAIPTGIITSEIAKANFQQATNTACPGCGSQGHILDAKFCRHCGVRL